MVFYTKTLEEEVLQSRNSSDRLNGLIARFKPFIASVARKQAGKFLEYGVDEELSVGLMAFQEAVGTYNESRGKFLNYARIVIKNRLIDFYRKQTKNQAFSIQESDIVIEEEMTKRSFENYAIDSEELDRKIEIIEYASMLSEWGISLIKLAKISPNSDSDKKMFQKIAAMIAKDEVLLKGFLDTKKLPLKEIEKAALINRKKVERARLYIIAMVLAILMNVSYLEINKDGFGP
jgi:RNA polymerase sigma factor